MAKINIVGVGPGSPDYVTPSARKTVQKAELVIGAQRSLNLFTDDIKGETIVLTAKNLNTVLKLAAKSVKKKKTWLCYLLVTQASQDYCIQFWKADLFEAEDINVVPGVSSIQACAAKASH